MAGSEVDSRGSSQGTPPEGRRRGDRLCLSLPFVLRHLSVEIIVFLIYLGYVFGNTFQAPAIYHRICLIYHEESACESVRDAHIEISVQERSAEWSIYNGLAYLTPALFADTVLGAFGDRYGWKTPIVLGVTGVVLAEFGYLLTLSYSVATPYWTTLLFGAAGGFSGSLAIIPVACNAFLAEVTEDSDLLTIRSALFSAFQTMACVFGGFAAAALYGSISVLVAMDIEIALLFGALLFALWRLPQRPPDTPINTDYKTPRPSCLESTRAFLSSILVLLKEGLNTYTRRRLGRRRAFLLLTLAVLVLNYTTTIETTTSGVMNSYVFRRVGSDTLDWGTDDLGWWNGSGYLIQAVGTLGGAWLFKRLSFRETTLMIIGVASGGARVLLIALADSDAVMYAANAAGIFSGLVQPAAVSFIVQLVARSEVGKAFSLLGIGGDLAFLIASATYALVYRASVAWEASVVFHLMAAVHLLALISLFWLHFAARADGIGGRRFSSQLTHAISRLGAAESVDQSSSPKKKWRPKPRKSAKISIAEHAETLEAAATQRGIWQSEEDLRATRLHRSLY